MTDMKLPPETAVAAYKAVATCTGTNKADVDTYKIMRFRIWEGTVSYTHLTLPTILLV